MYIDVYVNVHTRKLHVHVLNSSFQPLCMYTSLYTYTCTSCEVSLCAIGFAVSEFELSQPRPVSMEKMAGNTVCSEQHCKYDM